ncbi:thioredoxin family protein [Variovorax sp. WS11]|uniref:redoxin domain-containing protein n=1 Tax=Variovorax sp. WS11 TaxID=1105204 RepID=UPI000D0DDCEA|nr:redoxin domain-containing protein [Variovorax sp. WS11]NDZ13000.1 redoxin domain-containing protein [Variovorax sp. WS11]PSL80762.1 thioredoxin family protein [Variovorax sp. WS11]
MPSSSTADSRSYRAARQARAALSRASRRAVMAAAVALGATFLMGSHAAAAPAVGQRAPDFVAVDTAGKQHRLSDFAGKFVVLEWTNPGCPFVRKHYGSGNMPATQKAATEKGVVWLSVNSTERAAGDYLKPAALDAWMKEQAAAPTAVLMDEDGVIGRAYAARTTPHLYIIDPKGVLVYAGGIDSIASSRTEDIKTATNYVNQALGEAFGGKPISAATTKPYGCSIKYKA